jgi:hypothetical protein
MLSRACDLSARESIEINETAVDRHSVGKFECLCDTSAKNCDAPEVTFKHCLVGGLMCNSVICPQLCGRWRELRKAAFIERSISMRRK